MAEEGSFVPAGEKERLRNCRFLIQIRRYGRIFLLIRSRILSSQRISAKGAGRGVWHITAVMDTVREEEMVEYRDR